MARSLWTGSLSFGLVNVPVQLVTALRDRGVHFHQLHDADGVRITTVRVCPADGEQVPYDEVVRGYEVESGRYVTVSDEELEALAPERTRTIDIEEFVDLADIDPLRLDHPYYLLPQGEGGGTQRAYKLLQQVMADTGKVAIGRFVLRAKEYLVAVRAVADVMLLHTMVFDDEVNPRDDYRDLLGDTSDGVDERQLKAMRALIDELSASFDPERYGNQQRDRVLAMIERKAEGEEIVRQPEPPEPEPVPDLMAALEATLSEVRAKGDGGASKRDGKAERGRSGQRRSRSRA
jgi:DNA end-binding protein Ku